MTILTITHVMELVAEYARWVIVMHDGRVLLDGPPRQVFSRVEELRISAISPPPVARLGLILGPAAAGVLRRSVGAGIVGAYLLSVLLMFWYFYPVLAGSVIPYQDWLSHMWYRVGGHGWI